jgi:hypothetical protein
MFPLDGSNDWAGKTPLKSIWVQWKTWIAARN